MTAWADLGLPCPRRAEYGWRIDAGLARTPFAGPLPEQAVSRSSRRQTFDLAWLLTGEQLARAETYLLDQAYAGEGIILDLLTSAGFGPLTVRLCADLEVQPADGDLYRLRAQFETLVPVTPAVIDPTVWVYKLNLYAMVQGIATGAGVHKTNLYSVFNVLADQSVVLKANQYTVTGGIASGSAVNKANQYTVTGGIASGSAVNKSNLYVIIVTA